MENDYIISTCRNDEKYCSTLHLCVLFDQRQVEKEFPEKDCYSWPCELRPIELIDSCTL